MSLGSLAVMGGKRMVSVFTNFFIKFLTYNYFWFLASDPLLLTLTCKVFRRKRCLLGVLFFSQPRKWCQHKVDPLCATWKSEDCPGGPPNVLPRLPLFDGVGSLKFPNPSLPETLIPNETLYLLGSSFISSCPSFDPSSVLLPSCLPYARTFPSPEKPSSSHKSQTTTPDFSFRINCQLIWGMDWGRLDFWNWQGNGSDKRSGMGHD